MRLGALLSDAASLAGRVAPLALVPLAASLARWNDVVALAGRQDSHVGVKFDLPNPLADLWTFVDAPGPGRYGLYVDAPVALDAGLGVDALATAAAFALGSGLLMAGFVGSIDQFDRRGRYDFLRNVRAYGVRMVGFQAVVFAVLLLLARAAVVRPAALVVGIVVGFVAWFLFFPTPYLVVLEDRPLLEAFRESVRLTTGGVEPLRFVVVYGLVVVAGSLPASAIANAGLPGVLAAAALASGVGLVLTAYTVLFVRELVEASDTGADRAATSKAA